MIRAIVYSLEGYELSTAIDESPSLISKLEKDQAVETWQAGLVRSELSIRIKTIQAVSRLLKRAAAGSVLEITYQLVGTENELTETKLLEVFGRSLGPVLLPYGKPPVSDQKLVKRLGAKLGSYIRVTYRLMDTHPAEPHPETPFRQAYAAPRELILVGV
jgi:hypothetical protein